MKQINTVWVFADAADRYADLITGAKKTGAKVNAVVVSEAGVQALRASGPDAVYNLDVAAESCVENYAASLAAVIAGEGNLVLLDVTKRSKAFAAALSQKLGAALVNDALSLNPAADGLRVTFRTYGGLAVGTEKVLSANAVATVSGGVFAPEAAESSADLAVTKVAYVAPANALVVKERRAKAQSAVDLTKANTGWSANATSAFRACSSRATSTLRSASPVRFSTWSASTTAARSLRSTRTRTRRSSTTATTASWATSTRFSPNSPRRSPEASH